MLRSFKVDVGCFHELFAPLFVKHPVESIRVRGGAVSLRERLSDMLDVLKAVVAEAMVAVSASRRAEVGRLLMAPCNA